MVQFSSTNEVCLFRHDDNVDASELWYTKKDYKAMRIATKRAIQAVHKKELSIQTFQDASDVNKALNDTTGIENLLTPGITKKVRAAREQCWDSILMEQARQDATGERNPDKLSYVSKQCSAWSVKRAETIGFLHQMN